MKQKEKERTEARRLREQGLSLNEIVSILNVSKSSVSTWTRDITLEQKHKEFENQQKAKERNEIKYEQMSIDFVLLQQMVEIKGWSPYTISKKLKIGTSCVEYFIKKFGYKKKYKLSLCYDNCGLCEKYTGGRRYCDTCVSKIRRASNKLKGIEILGGSCKRCGWEPVNDMESVALEFHHCEGKKEYKIGLRLNRSWKRLKLEIIKCELLCSRCHRICHSDRDQKLYDVSKTYLIF